MIPVLIVLNAGSSSLKFCVFERPAAQTWKLAARGQIEGIGTSPHMRVKDGEGGVVADEALGATVRDASTALDSLAVWFRGRFGNGLRSCCRNDHRANQEPKY